jgi:hypothetical protein
MMYAILNIKNFIYTIYFFVHNKFYKKRVLEIIGLILLKHVKYILSL